MEWYGWLAIILLFIIALPFKVKFMKWWSKQNQKQKKGKWGDEE
ncbi:hypothetical protein ACS127_12830 [Amphibacillus sp. Q70]